MGLIATLPDDTPIYYHTSFDLPEVTDEEINEFCSLSTHEKEEYYQEKIQEAHQFSDRLEEYIKEWYYDNAPPEIPPEILPPYIDTEKTKKWRLYHPDEIEPEDQWYIWTSPHPVPEDFSGLTLQSLDNHATYIKLIFIAPFDSLLLIEGDFPHARFMDYQIIGPFDPRNPTTSGFGAPEIPIVDVDIEPDSGHTNPFRIGADRNAENRHYHLTFDLKEGNAADLNPQAMEFPDYRAPGNRRVGGPFAFSGIQGGGVIIPSLVWLRYYAPDKGTGVLGGVDLPKAKLKLKTGEEFWLGPDFSLAERRQNKRVPGVEKGPFEPGPWSNPAVGWYKIFGFWLTFAEGKFSPLTEPFGKWLSREQMTNILNERIDCLFGRGYDKPPPGNHEAGASSANYHTYLYRTMELGSNKVYVFTGKLPRTPQTLEGDPIATSGDVRYWSICHTNPHGGEGDYYKGLLYGCLMDEEVTTDSNDKFIIVYSRDGERPRNAREECGVTWQRYGPESRQTFNLRWMSVMPDDYLPEYSPDANNIPWETGAWSSPNYDRSLIGYNNQRGVMNVYQPLIHYMTKEEFEALGCPEGGISPDDVPEWECNYTTNWHLGRCRECERPFYRRVECENRWMWSREVCERDCGGFSES